MVQLKQWLSVFAQRYALQINQTIGKFDYLQMWWLHVLIVLSLSVMLVWADRPIADWMHQINLSCCLLDWIKKFQGYVMILILLVLASVARLIKSKVWHNRWGFVAGWVTLVYVICGVLKCLLGRARPDAWIQLHLFGFYGIGSTHLFQSFPSGHTSSWVATALGVALFFPRHLSKMVVCAVLISLTRVLSNAHYLSDVLATTYLTILEWRLLLAYLTRVGHR